MDFPANKLRNKSVIITSKRHLNVIFTYLLRTMFAGLCHTPMAQMTTQVLPISVCCTSYLVLISEAPRALSSVDLDAASHLIFSNIRTTVSKWPHFNSAVQTQKSATNTFQVHVSFLFSRLELL